MDGWIPRPEILAMLALVVYIGLALAVVIALVRLARAATGWLNRH